MSLRKRGKKIPKIYWGIYAVAILAAILLAIFLPVPAEWKKLLFFMLIIAFAFLGVIIYNFIGKK